MARVKREPKPINEDEVMDVNVFKCLDLRVQGFSTREIAAKMELPIGLVSTYLSQGMKTLETDIKEKAEDARALELARLDAIVAVHFPFIENVRNAELIIKTMERRAKFRALDAQPDNDKDDAVDTLRAFLAAARASTAPEE